MISAILTIRLFIIIIKSILIYIKGPQAIRKQGQWEVRGIRGEQTKWHKLSVTMEYK